MTEPTDAEIWQMWMPMVRRMGVADPVEFARAVLAKWGTPAPVGVESACQRCRGSGEDPEGYYDQSRGPDGATHDGPCRICAGSGGAPVVLAKWGTPQPTQAQAGAVPLTDEQIDQAIAELGLNYLADAHATNRAVLRKLCHHAHDIKGGKHGADTPEQNRDEIIAMALVAGMSANIGYTDASGEHFPAVAALKTSVPVQWLERFAALVAAKEREACAQVCEGFKQGNSATYIDDDWADMCAAAIRARGKP